MTCPAIQTGQNFLGMTLYHVDCQAQALGAYGFGALADPGSPVSLALTGLLTLFVALFGLRLLLGTPIAGRDLIGDMLRLGIVLTLATSWPAWRVIGYELVIHGPEQIARSIGMAAQLPGSAGNLLEHLQWTDQALAALGETGSGRLGVAQGDWFQLGMARSAYLTGTLAPLALVKLSAGILLALAPLMAGLLLFGLARPLFVGWVKGLVLTFLASIALTLILGVELALLEPWLKDALEQRAAGNQVLDAPVEALVLTLAFGLTSIGTVLVMGWVAFHTSVSLTISHLTQSLSRHSSLSQDSQQTLTQIGGDTQLRAQSVAMAVAQSQHREQRLLEHVHGAGVSGQGVPGAGGPAGHSPHLATGEALGSSYRRNTRRVSQAGAKRDSSA